VRISVGAKELDELLLHPKLHGKVKGGLESMLITEAFGKFSSGKSQIGFQAAVNVQLPKEQGGLDSGCIFLDTESTFKSLRIREIAESRGMDANKVLQNIYCARVVSSDHFMKLLLKAEDLIRDGKAKLVVVDSIMAPFRHEYRGRDQLPLRQGALNDVLMTLQNMANIYNIPIYVTNQVMDNPNGMPFMDPTIPVGGNILAHATCRLYLRKGKDNKRVARLVDSSSLPLGEAIFKITEKGIEDVEEV
jgi:DNA repair protein RadA